VFILKGLKVLCFDTLLQVFILNVLRKEPIRHHFEADLKLKTVFAGKIGKSRDPAETESTPHP
jgi:hypothetical protein